MTESFRFLDALTYGIRTLLWRPTRALAYIAATSLATGAYYFWCQSEGGIAFFTAYMQTVQEMSQGNFAGYGRYFGLLLGSSLIFGSVMIAGGYRVYLRDQSALRLPLQLGLDELRTLGLYLLVFGVMLGVMIGVVILMIIAIILVSILISPLIAAMSNDASQAALVGGILGVGLMLPFMLALGYIMGRLGVCFAFVIRDRKISLSGWTASKGAGMQLLMAHVVLYLVLTAAQFLLAPGLMTAAYTSGANPGAAANVAELAAMMANPYGDLLIIAVPLQALIFFLIFGPTAALAQWDTRKRAAAEPVLEAAPAAEPESKTGKAE